MYLILHFTKKKEEEESTKKCVQCDRKYVVSVHNTKAVLFQENKNK